MCSSIFDFNATFSYFHSCACGTAKIVFSPAKTQVFEQNAFELGLPRLFIPHLGSVRPARSCAKISEKCMLELIFHVGLKLCICAKFVRNVLFLPKSTVSRVFLNRFQQFKNHSIDNMLLYLRL